MIRNENLAKNRFYCALRKYLRVVNQFLKGKAKRSKNQKEVKYESIIRVLEVRESLPEHLKLVNYELRSRIIDEVLVMALDNECRLDTATQEFIASINKFNLGTRNFKTTKSKGSKNQGKQKVAENESVNGSSNSLSGATCQQISEITVSM